MCRKLSIDPEFKSLLPPLEPEALDLLRENISENGPPIVTVWRHNGEIVVVDGHHGYQVCQEQDIEPIVKEKAFKDRETVLRYIRRIHLGRRNMTEEIIRIQRGALYNEVKSSRGGDRRSADQSANVGTLKSVHQPVHQLAETEGVSVRTLKRDGELAETATALTSAGINNNELTPEERKRLSDLPKEKRLALIAKGNAALKAALSEQPKPARTKKSDPAHEPKPVKDELDVTVPDSLITVFTAASEARKALSAMKSVTKQVNAFAESDGGKRFKGDRHQSFKLDFGNARRTLRFDIPYAVCPVCSGDHKKRKGKCHCRESGWLTETEYGQLPSEYRQ